MKNDVLNEKTGFKKYLLALPQREFFMIILLISNHMVLLVQFGINLHLKVLKKAEIALAEAAPASAFSCEENRNNSITRKFAYIFDVFPCVSKDEK